MGVQTCAAHTRVCAHTRTHTSEAGFQVEKERGGMRPGYKSGLQAEHRIVPGVAWGQGSEPSLTDTYLIRGCVHVCSSVILSFHPEHVSVTGCLSLALHAGLRVLDGSNLSSVLLPVSVRGSGPVGQAPHPPAGQVFSLSCRACGSSPGLWPLCDHPLQRGCGHRFSWARTYL